MSSPVLAFFPACPEVASKSSMQTQQKKTDQYEVQHHFCCTVVSSEGNADVGLGYRVQICERKGAEAGPGRWRRPGVTQAHRSCPGGA